MPALGWVAMPRLRPRPAHTRVGLLLATAAALVTLAACGSGEQVLVPDVQGLTVDQAAERLCSRFLEPRVEGATAQGRVGAPTVVGSEPAAGQETDVDGAVTLLVAVPAGAALPPAPTCD